jgi:hypothetical protein
MRNAREITAVKEKTKTCGNRSGVRCGEYTFQF